MAPRCPGMRRLVVAARGCRVEGLSVRWAQYVGVGEEGTRVVCSSGASA